MGRLDSSAPSTTTLTGGKMADANQDDRKYPRQEDSSRTANNEPDYHYIATIQGAVPRYPLLVDSDFESDESESERLIARLLKEDDWTEVRRKSQTDEDMQIALQIQQQLLKEENEELARQQSQNSEDLRMAMQMQTQLLKEEREQRMKMKPNHEDEDLHLALRIQREEAKQRVAEAEEEEARRKSQNEDDLRLAMEIQREEEERSGAEEHDKERLKIQSEDDLQLALRIHREEAKERAEQEQHDEEESLRLAERLARQAEALRAAQQREQEEESARLAQHLLAEDYHSHRHQYFMNNPIALTKRDVLDSLEDCQREALQNVERLARPLHVAKLESLRVRVERLGYTQTDLNHCLEYIREDAPIIIHLKRSALEKLVDDTHYRNLFETSTSGGTTSKEARALWENAMFGGAYNGTQPFDRPKYGCLNLTGDILGVRSAAPIYGWFFLTLQPNVRYRTTFFDRDSDHFASTSPDPNKNALATNELYAHVLQSYDDKELKAVLGVSRLEGAPSTAISVYKEVQVHGPIALANDIQALSVPAKSTTADEGLTRLVERFQELTRCNILWQDDLLGL